VLVEVIEMRGAGMFTKWIVAVGLSLTGACAAPLEEDSSSSASEIRSGATTTAHPAVGMLYFNADWTCTGTQLGPQIVLAAAHCAYSAPQRGYAVTKVTAQTAPRSMMFYPAVSTSGYYDTTGGVVVDRVYAWKSAGGNSDPDLALFHLASPRTLTRYASVGAAVPTTDLNVTAVGYGCSATGRGFYTKRERSLRWLSDLQPATTNSMAGFSTETATGAVLCPGDSGGPLYDGTYIFGIASAGDGSASFWVDATAMQRSITAALGAFDAVPSSTPPTGAPPSAASVCTQGAGFWCADASGNIPAGYSGAAVGSDVSLFRANCVGGRASGALERCASACVKAARGAPDRCR
jgi:V8-like Glu-specific endopeptidase